MNLFLNCIYKIKGIKELKNLSGWPLESPGFGFCPRKGSWKTRKLGKRPGKVLEFQEAELLMFTFYILWF